jgi:hypothetical protein
VSYYNGKISKKANLGLIFEFKCSKLHFAWNLTIGELMTICVVNTSHMISLSHKWAVSFSNLEAIDQFVDCSRCDKELTIV